MHRGLGRVLLVVAAAACFAAPAAAGDGLIGVFADLSATQTAATFAVGVPRTLYILAQLDGLTAGGMSGAEFRVDGAPADWVTLATPNPAAAVALGDPFHFVSGVGRANIAFQYCTGGSDSLVLLYTVVVVPLSEIAATDLRVVVADPPTNPTYATPVLSLFPQQAPAEPGDNLRAMQVRHLLTMTAGHHTDPTGAVTSARVVQRASTSRRPDTGFDRPRP